MGNFNRVYSGKQKLQPTVFAFCMVVNGNCALKALKIHQWNRQSFLGEGKGVSPFRSKTDRPPEAKMMPVS